MVHVLDNAPSKQQIPNSSPAFDHLIRLIVSLKHPDLSGIRIATLKNKAKIFSDSKFVYVEYPLGTDPISISRSELDIPQES
jgi:hypothetical protein